MNEQNKSRAGERARMARASLRIARGRAARAVARAEAAEAALARQQASAAWRMTFPVRRLAHAVPPSLYAALRGGRRVRDSDAIVDAGAVARAILPAAPPLALIIDDHFPDPDSDSGSIDIVNLSEALRDEGFAVSIAADRDHGDERKPSRAGLIRRGLQPLGSADGIDTSDVIRRLAPRAALIVLNRVYCGGRFLESIAAAAPLVPVIFNTIDLHWVRIGREAALTNDARLRAAGEDARRRERSIASAADATLVVSERERALLEADVPGSPVLALPLARPSHAPQTPFAERFGVGFIGGFRHAPNVDGLGWFIDEVWPRVRARCPAIRLSVVGADLPPALMERLGDGAEALGPVRDVQPWFERVRVTIAPLRYGAGVKGKVVSSLSAGVPCVGTTVALEGVEAADGHGAALADDPAPFADAIIALHEDEALWRSQSDAAFRFATVAFSMAAYRERVRDLLWSLDLLAPCDS